MLRSIHTFLYGSVPSTFRSPVGLAESVERLRRATKRTVFSALASQEAVGKVRDTEVSLQRAIPFVGNSYKPFFVGRFEQDERGVVLVGRFTMHWSVKVFNTVWFGICFLWTILATVSVATSEIQEWYAPLFGIGMLIAGALLVYVGKWFARNDQAWLSRIIESALSGSSAA